MKNLYPKTIILTLIACLIAVVSNAQLRNPVNILLNFYGRVVDQEGKPVVGAKVNLEAQANYFDEHRSEQKPFTVQTDKNGDFNLIGAYGAIVTVSSIEKDGFELSKKVDRHYSYTLPADFHPDLQNPVIFKMWKQQGKEPLVGSNWHGKVACDGTTNRFDLFHGRRSADGSLEIVCTRMPLNLPPANTAPFTWNVQITVIGGAIQPANDEFAYLAPETGYMPLLTYGQQADDSKWDRQMPMPKDYYIKTSDGHYGRLSLEWDRAFWQSPTILKWDCSINPSGSRNLER
jgi:hypothetical protein